MDFDFSGLLDGILAVVTELITTWLAELLSGLFGGAGAGIFG